MPKVKNEEYQSCKWNQISLPFFWKSYQQFFTDQLEGIYNPEAMDDSCKFKKI